MERADYYVAVLTAVPVLWITAGLSSASVARIFERLRDSGLVLTFPRRSLFGIPVTYVVSPDRAVVRYRPFVYFGRTREAVLIDAPGSNLAAKSVSVYGVILFVLAGAVAGIASLTELVRQHDSPVVAGVTFVCAVITFVLAGLALLISLATTLTETFGGAVTENGDSPEEPPI